MLDRKIRKNLKSLHIYGNRKRSECFRCKNFCHNLCYKKLLAMVRLNKIDFVVTSKGEAISIPKAATEPVDIVNPAEKTTGIGRLPEAISVHYNAGEMA